MSRQPTPVAVVAFSGRFPGGADTAEALWEALESGRDLIEPVPASRWNSERLHHPGGKAGLDHSSRFGGFLRDIDLFDPAAFGISPREAATMDPGQRLLLEQSWRCWEQAGIAPADWAQRPVGIFVGAFTQDYLQLQLGGTASTISSVHSATGAMQTLLSNRISYCHGFTGPSLTVDTACSSSLVALHLAIASLERGESELALAGGIQLQLSPYYTAMESRGGFLSPDGRCFAFDARANGYVRSEAAVMLLLAPLDRALREGWPVEALIHASVVNQNGKPAGISLPNPDAQQALIDQGLAQAGLTADDLGYVEAHGTGTRAGDRAEALALGRALGGRRSGGPLPIGSIKTNLGHAEAAAGLTGLIKVLLCMRHRRIAPHLHWQRPQPGMDLAAANLRLPLTAEAWPDEAPYAAVNSFGFGGTNAFVIVGPAPAPAEPALRARPAAAALPHLLMLSAPTAGHLPLQARAMAQFLEALPAGADLAGIGAATLYQRQPFAHSLGIVGGDRAALQRDLADFVQRPGSSDWALGERRTTDGADAAWVFAGMGPQWRGMGSELARAFPVFAETFQSGAARFTALTGYSPLDDQAALRSPDEALPAGIAQPLALFFQLALTALLRSVGIRPVALVGHSVGEIAAFHAAGAIETDTALALVWTRSRLQARLAGRGGMLALEGGDAAELCARHGLCLAARNGPEKVTVSGPNDRLEALAAELAGEGRQVRKLPVDLPYHSALMAPLEGEFRAALRGLAFRPASVPLYSTVTGGRLDDVASLDFADYWWRNLREPVAFSSAVGAMRPLDPAVLLEISAYPVLQAYLREALPGGETVAIGTLRKHRPESVAFVECLARLHACGVRVDWPRLYPRPAGRVPLPGIVWRRERYWSESSDSRALRLDAADHPLLGYRRPDGSLAWDVDLRDRPEWGLADHRVLGQPRLPAALYVEMLCAACRLAAPGSAPRLTELRFHRGAVLNDASGLRLSTELDEADGSIRIFGPGRQLLVEARCATAWEALLAPKAPPRRAKAARRWTGRQFYAALRRLGYNYGPTFRRVASVGLHQGGSSATIDGCVAPGLAIAPAVLDACLHSMLAIDLLGGKGESHRLPVSIGELRLHRAPTAEDFPLRADCSQQAVGSDLSCHLRVYARTGRLVAEMLDLRMLSPGLPSALSGGRRPADTLFQLSWKTVEAKAPAGAPKPRHWLLRGAAGTAKALGEQLGMGGDTVWIADPADSPDSAWERLSRLPADAVGAIVDLQPLDWPEAEDGAREGLDRLMRDWRRLARLADPRWPLWSVTRGACDPHLPRPEQAAIWGLARTLADVELPRLLRGVVDVAAGGSDWPRRLADLLRSRRRENQFRLAGDQWQVPELVACAGKSDPDPLWLRRDASYIVTGAFGALGRLTVRFLIDHGARNLILIGSRALPARSRWSAPQPDSVRERIDWISDLERGGTRVLALGFGIERAANWQGFADCLRGAGMPPIRGIVHAAGAAADRAFLDSDRADFDTAFGAKVDGARHLFDSVAGAPLDFALLYSSVSALLPAYGQAAYAAANCALDAFASVLRGRGIPARTLSWGPWTVGMAADPRLRRLFERQGLLPIAPDEGYRILSQVFSQAEPALYGVALDWPRFIDSHPRRLWLFGKGLAGIETKIVAERAKRMRARGKEGASHEIAFADLIGAAAEVMRLKEEDLLPTSNLCQMGLDSLMAVEVQLSLGKSWRRPLDLADLLGRSSLAQLAQMLVEHSRFSTQDRPLNNRTGNTPWLVERDLCAVRPQPGSPDPATEPQTAAEWAVEASVA